MFVDAPPIMPDPESAEVMVATINEIREARRLPRVFLRDDLECAAASWAKNQWRAKSCAHTDPTRSEFPQRVQQCGGWLNGGYELIACGVKDFKTATGMWLRDLSSASALLQRDVEAVGIGHAGWDSSARGNWYVLILEFRQP